MLTLYCQLLNHVMEKLLSSQTTWSSTRTLQSTTSRSKTAASLDKLSSNLSKDCFKETRKYLESFYVQQPNQPQINNEHGKGSEVMHVYEDYQNHSYQLPTLTPNQEQEIEEGLAVMMKKGV